MFKVTLTEQWTKVSSLENRFQFRANNGDHVLVYFGETPSDNAAFLLKHNTMFNMNKDIDTWARVVHGKGAVVGSYGENLLTSCFVIDGSFDCGGWLLEPALVYCS